MLPPSKRFRKNWVSETEVYCPKCALVKNVNEFNKSNTRSTGIQYFCKPCLNEYKSERNKLNYERYKDFRRKARYGIPIGMYDELLKRQDYKCKICNLEKKLSIDHNHTTGEVRGLLCMDCNTALGKFKDNKTILTNAIKYLGTVCYSSTD